MLIGRIEEQEILKKTLSTNKSELIAVFGRRRVGKTFLVKQTFKENICFELTGLQNSTLQGQLQNFVVQLERFSDGNEINAKPQNWLDAFYQLSKFLEKKIDDQKQVVFFDEVPWLAGPKSNFLMGFSWFWNSWAENQNINVVICGSAASWMIQKIVNDRGGLHNRITKRIFLEPFTLKETEAFLEAQNAYFNRYQIAQIYMATGGIPHYLKEIESGKSAIQNINKLCFSKNGLLNDEFTRLYQALFANADNHLSIVRTLAQSHQGLTRSEILKNSKLPEGGNTSRALEELEQSGFIKSYFAFGKQKKEVLYRLTDEYSLFYLRFIEKNKNESDDTWNQISQTQNYKTWSGYAFENICIKHLKQIKMSLGISGIYSQSSTFFQKGNDYETGTQIDLVLDRNDNVVSIFEIKFYNSEWTLTEDDAKSIRNKLRIFKEKTKTKKQLMAIGISPFGIILNKHSIGLIEQNLSIDSLFIN
jgi:uncharacterized protein